MSRELTSMARSLYASIQTQYFKSNILFNVFTEVIINKETSVLSLKSENRFFSRTSHNVSYDGTQEMTHSVLAMSSYSKIEI